MEFLYCNSDTSAAIYSLSTAELTALQYRNSIGDRKAQRMTDLDMTYDEAVKRLHEMNLALVEEVRSVKERQEAGELTTILRKEPSCHECGVAFVGEHLTPLMGDDVYDLRCHNCNARQHHRILDSIHLWYETGGYQKPRGRPRSVGKFKTLNVRMEPSEYTKFINRCGERNIPASEVIRSLIDRYMDESSTA